MDIQALFEKVDQLFEENQAKEAEKLLLEIYKEAKLTKDNAMTLQILNELIGYYRQTSEKEKLFDIMNEAIQLAEKMQLENTEQGKIAYATTLLNVANGYRSIGMLAEAQNYYEHVKGIYQDTLEESDMRLAGLYNNMSLLQQELEQYEDAKGCLLKALAIAKANHAEFEIAVTYANLANTEIAINRELLKQGLQEQCTFQAARDYALESIELFEKRNVYDAHYCAAISALGMYYYYENDYAMARTLFQRGMDIVEQVVGRNAQYMRLKENRDMCNGKFVSGLDISKAFYEECGKKALQEKFPNEIDQMIIGLVGEGSDCFGYDDEASRDHDWGPGFCIWLEDALYESIGAEVQSVYDSLPQVYLGYERFASFHGNERVGVHRLSVFLEHFIGTDAYEKIDWRQIQDYDLAAVTNGMIFSSPVNDKFTMLREQLMNGYPEEIQYLKLAEDAGKFSQNCQYNYARMLKRGDRFSADAMLLDGLRHAMKLVHHMLNKYPPHEKWLMKSFVQLTQEMEELKPILECINRLHDSLKLSDDIALERVTILTEELGSLLAKELYAHNFISDVDAYLDHHTEELVQKSFFAKQDDIALITTIAKTEFKAFDQVKNEGGRASCQDDWPTFYVMRKSQYLTWNRTMLLQYIYDFNRELNLGHNLITEKYGRMMESTAPEKYKELENHFPILSEEKKAIIEQIVGIQMGMLEEFGDEYPKAAGNARSFHTYEDNFMNTSYETYLRGEISTYSDKMLQLYGAYVVTYVTQKRNIARETIENTVKLYGYKSLDAFEQEN